MSKDLEIFTAKDFSSWGNVGVNIAEKANRILRERGQVGYTGLDVENFPSLITDEQLEFDTHEILYILRPIEDEVVECDLDHKTILSLNKHLKEIVAKSSEMAAFGSVVTMEYEECPKCGKDLR